MVNQQGEASMVTVIVTVGVVVLLITAIFIIAVTNLIIINIIKKEE